jgi:TRAP-type C4-dicarboxylate transport system permease small subunit
VSSLETTATGAKPHAEPRFLSRLIWPVEVVTSGVVGIATLLVLVFTLGQIADRYVLKGTFNAYDQIGRIALIWMTFLGAALAFRKRLNIAVDLINIYLPAKVVAVKAVALDALSLVLMLFMFGYSIRLLEVGAFQGVLGTPLTYREVYVSLVIGTTLFILFLGVRILAATITLFRRARA